MTNQNIKMMLMAFNNECDAAVSNIKWNNAVAMEKRIQRAYEKINKINEVHHLHINGEFLKLKIKELRLTHEYREKQKEERDHAAEMRRLKREEEKLLQEQKQCEKTESDLQKRLDKARKDAESADGQIIAKYESEIEELKRLLAEAHEKTERARSMAEQTRAGYVYIISNIGAFGDNVFKIGMTRRLDPEDRVKELGDASVPFGFDVHAMVYFKDAPSIERKLHAVFDDKRVNKVNNRKEFFAVGIDEIRKELQKIAPDADFITECEAEHYRETQHIINVEKSAESKKSDFPDSI